MKVLILCLHIQKYIYIYIYVCVCVYLHIYTDTDFCFHIATAFPCEAPLSLSLGESRLESVGSDWTSLPLLEESTLRKATRPCGCM